ncbi:MAG: hypothetical protein CVT49_06550 [candidate division Zixibacteria bacterium HGW-Zixibacteria-1]|nr:MAG: hypothetical protein CVT49_06550 [candidate division Zixibacteria bacterium HGW-Zixibacteria-1]
MKTICRLIFFGVLVLFCSAARAQYTDEQMLNRWLSKKPVIDSITIKMDGDSPFTHKKIRSVLYSYKSDIPLLNLLSAIRGDRRRRVQRETIMRDTAEVKYLFLSAGFLGVQVRENFEPILPDSNALVRINVETGRRFYYDTVLVDGRYEPRLNGDIIKLTRPFRKEKPVDPFKLKQAEYDMKSVLANNGYPYASVIYSIDTTEENNEAVINFNIDSDSLVHFGDVRIVGVDKFDTSLVERELTFRKGDQYRRKDIIKSQKRLLETGYYFTLRLNSTVQDTSAMQERLNPDFLLTLREKRAQHISVKTGAAQDSLKDLIWSFSGAWSKRNFLQSRYLELSARSSFVIFTEWRLNEHSYRARITEPWFLGLRMPLTLTAQVEPGVRSLVQPYRKQTWYVSVTTTWNVTEKLKLLTGLQYEKVNIYGVSKEAELQIKQEEGIKVRRKFYVNLVRDSRNNLFVPSQGSVTGLRFEYIGGFLGGDDSFYQLESSWSRYRRIWPGWISATRFKAGFLQEMKDSPSVPTDDRYYIGGANTIRGFAENELGPRSAAGNFSGADIIVIFNQELRYPIIGKLWGSLFTDIGNGYINRDDIKFKNLALSYGLGIQFVSPAGPIRLDYARHIRSEGIEPGDKVHFTILYAF